MPHGLLSAMAFLPRNFRNLVFVVVVVVVLVVALVVVAILTVSVVYISVISIHVARNSVHSCFAFTPISFFFALYAGPLSAVMVHLDQLFPDQPKRSLPQRQIFLLLKVALV